MNLKLMGMRIKELRLSLDMSQDKLAEKTGLSDVYIQKIESGEKIPSLDKCVLICDALGTTLDVLICEDMISSEKKIASIMDSCSEEEKEIIYKTSKALRQALKDKQNQ